MRRLFTKETADRFAFCATSVVAAGTGLHYATRMHGSPDDSTMQHGQDATPAASAPSSRRNYRFSLDRSALNFRTSHWGMTVRGRFSNFDGEIHTEGVRGASSDTSTPTEAAPPSLLNLKRVDVKVRADSIDTENWLRDRRMRNEFLEAEKYEFLEFSLLREAEMRLFAALQEEGADAAKTGEGGNHGNPTPVNEHKVHGLVRIRGIEKPLSLDVVVSHYGEKQLRAKVVGELDRFDFDLLSNWPSLAVGRVIYLDFDLLGERI